MTISDEVTAAIATTHHDRGGVLDATLDLIQLTQRLIEFTALERLQLGVARQHQRHHGTHTDIMRTGCNSVIEAWVREPPTAKLERRRGLSY
jgi:hypothetical protein